MRGCRLTGAFFTLISMLCVQASQAQILLHHDASITTYKPSTATTVQDISPLVTQRGTFVDGTLRSGSMQPWRLEADTIGSTWWNNEALHESGVWLDTGTFQIDAVDLALPSRGFAWVVGRSYNSRQNDSSSYVVSEGYQGNNWFQSSQPELLFYDDATTDADDMLYLVYGADRFVEFKRVGTGEDEFRGVNGANGVIQHTINASAPDIYTLYEPFGNETEFFGIGDADIADAKEGQLWRITDPAGNRAYVGHETNATTALSNGIDSSGRFTTAYDPAGRRYTYAYSASAIGSVKRLESVVVEQDESSTWVEVSKVEYFYHDGTDAHGSAGDLKRVTTTLPTADGTEDEIQDQYFRYYKGTFAADGPSVNPGHVGQLKYVLDAEGCRRFDWIESGAGHLAETFDHGYEKASDTDIKTYAAAYFEYEDDNASNDDHRRIAAGWLNGECGCAGASNGSHIFDYLENSSPPTGTGYDNDWLHRTEVTYPADVLGDVLHLVQYFDETGQPLSQIMTDGDPATAISDETWGVRAVRDTDGLVESVHSPENLSVYTHTGASAGDITSETGAGLVYYFKRSTTSPLTGFAHHFKVREGAGTGSRILAQTADYATRSKTIGAATLYRVDLSSKWTYTQEGTTEVNLTTQTGPAGAYKQGYAQTYWSNTNGDQTRLALKKVTTTHPVVSTANNGSGVAEDEKKYFRKDGTIAFFESARGVYTFNGQDSVGLANKSIGDADTDEVGSGSVQIPTEDDPTNWGIPANVGALHEVSAQEYDDQSRPSTGVLAPTSTHERTIRLFATVLEDRRLVQLAIPRVTGTTTKSYEGPVSYMVFNHAGQLEFDSVIGLANPVTLALTSWIDDTDGDDPQAALHAAVRSLVRLQTNQFDSSGRKLVSNRVYHNIPDYPLTTLPGLFETNYEETLYGYDSRGRRDKVHSVVYYDTETPPEPHGTIVRQTFDVHSSESTGKWIGDDDSAWPDIDNGGVTKHQAHIPGTNAGFPSAPFMPTYSPGGGIAPTPPLSTKGGGGGPFGPDGPKYADGGGGGGSGGSDGGGGGGDGLGGGSSGDGTSGGGNGNCTNCLYLDPSSGDCVGPICVGGKFICVWIATQNPTGESEVQTSTHGDYRGRTTLIERSVDSSLPHILMKVDGRGIIVARAAYKHGNLPNADDDPTTLATGRLALTEYAIDERVRIWKMTQWEIDSSGNKGGKIQIYYWYNEDGQIIKERGRQLVKRQFDSLGRLVREYVLAQDDDSVFASVDDVAGDIVLEERIWGYEDDSGDLVVSAVIERYHDDYSTGETTGALDTNADGNDLKLTASNLNGRAYITGFWYDNLGRLSDRFEFGTYGAATFDRGSMSTAPTRSDTALGTSYSYDTAGEVEKFTDARGKISRVAHDDAGRTVLSVMNDTGASTPLSDTTRDNDLHTRFVLSERASVTGGAKILVHKLWVDIDGDGVEDSDDQVTTYRYGVSTYPHMLYEAQYPDSTGGSDVVRFAYGRNLETFTVTDQIGNVIVNSYNGDGFLSSRSSGAEIIDFGYDALGRLDTATHTSGSVINEVEFGYDGWGNIDQFDQDHDSVIGGTGTAAYAVSYTHDEINSNDDAYPGTSVGRHSVRREQMTLPGSYTVDYEFLSTGGRYDDASGRVSRIKRGTTVVSAYEYLGTSRVVGIDYSEPEVYRNHFGSTSGSYPDLDRFGRVTSDRWSRNPVTEIDFFDTDRTYDRNSNPTVADDLVHKSAFDYAWTIDGVDRVEQSERGSWSGTAISTLAQKEVWDYTVVGGWDLHKFDLTGDGSYTGSDDLQDKRSLNDANEITARDTDNSGGTPEYAPTWNARGELTDDKEHYRYTYNVWGQLTKVEKTASPHNLVAEYTYNGLGYLITIHEDQDADGVADANDPVEHLVYDEQWRVVSIFEDSNTLPAEAYIHHNAGYDGFGRSSYVDELVLRDRDPTGGEAEGALSERIYYCQNMRKDVVAIVDDSANQVEQMRYSAYGVPTNLPAGDTDSDGDTDNTDWATAYYWAVTVPTYDIRADIDLDGDVDLLDVIAIGNLVGSNGGRAKQSLASVNNRFGYAGYLWDRGIGKNHVRNRVYDPFLGRWITRDPIEYNANTSNLYEYSLASPNSFVDPLGLQPQQPGRYRGPLLGIPYEIPGDVQLLPGMPDRSSDASGGKIGGNPVSNLLGSAIYGCCDYTGYSTNLANMTDREMYIIGIGVPIVIVPTIYYGIKQAACRMGGRGRGCTPSGAKTPGAYPGNNITRSPGKGWEWKPRGQAPCEGGGSWFNSKTGESLRPDLMHKPPIGPHWDWVAPDGIKYRWFPDGTIIPTK